MSQHIGIKIIDESFNTLNTVDTNFVALIRELKSLSTNDLINLIDEYGLTIFNKKQLAYLTEKIQGHEDVIHSKGELAEFLVLMDKVDYHQFLVLIGD
jgi:hypothetical protein